jgi:hypothetical protein
MLNLQPIRDRLGPDFRPFALHLSDGRSFTVPHPDFIAVGRGVLVLVDEQDRTHILDALHIVSLDRANDEKQNGG